MQAIACGKGKYSIHNDKKMRQSYLKHIQQHIFTKQIPVIQISYTQKLMYVHTTTNIYVKTTTSI